MLKSTTRTNIAGESTFRIATEHKPLDDTLDVCTLIDWDFTFQTVVALGLPMIPKYLAKIVMTGGKINGLI